MSSSNKKRYTIAIMLGDTQSDYSEALLRGFYTCSQEENVNILYLMGSQMPPYCLDILSCDTEGDYLYQFNTVYNYAHFVKPDALIITYGSLSFLNSTASRQLFLDQYKDIPYLLLEELPEQADVPYLVADNYNGMCACVRHLILDHGYRKIAFLSGPKNNRDSAERLKAYYDVMHENNLSVTDTMVAVGDFTDQVSKQVSFLLDSNPGLEAIVCASDSMAKGCYSVCASRDLLIGRDIAVTGFDDVEFARSMEPPLTTISHSIFQFSYTALKNAIMLCKGKEPASKRMPVTFRRRSSCGCPSVRPSPGTYIPADEMETFILRAIGSITSELLSGIPYKKERNKFGKLIVDYFHYIYVTLFKHDGQDFHMDYLIAILKQFTTYPHISNVLLLEHFSSLLQIMLANARNDTAQRMLTSIITATQQNIHAANIIKLEREIRESNRQAWFVPSFTRDLAQISSSKDFRNTMGSVMNRMKMMRIKSAYFYFFDKPIPHHSEDHLVFPKEIILTNYFNDSETVCFENGKCPRVTTENGLISFIRMDHPACLTAFVLFSNEKQYGIIICEVELEDISFLQICSIQLGSLMHFLELEKLEQESQVELQNSIKVIQEQNNILSFISEYDELSHLLNRRGFMERALPLCEKNVGKKAYLIFADLDHLKEINDCFGHAAGDFAISSASDRLRDVLPSDAITARIGGDEFLSLMLSEEEDFKEHILRKLRQAGDEFNSSSGEPYYVDFSFGIYEFTCDPQIDLNQIIGHSDALLYQAKKNRKASIKKAI